jgi:hypothetical protein
MAMALRVGDRSWNVNRQTSAEAWRVTPTLQARHTVRAFERADWPC